MLEKKCHISTWVLGYTILSEVIEELLERIDDNFTHIKHLIDSNVEVGTPPLFSSPSSASYFLSNFSTRAGSEEFTKTPFVHS